MTHFTFETAYIVAHLQNSANEALKERIRDRLIEYCWFDNHARLGWENFETFCWAWQNHCLAAPGGETFFPPPVNCCPYKDTEEALARRELQAEIQRVEDMEVEREDEYREDLECEGAPEVLTPADIAERQSALEALNEGYRYPDEAEIPW